MSSAINDGGIKSTNEQSSMSLGSAGSLLDRDYDAIERDIFGVPAIDCLAPSSENHLALPQGSPFLFKAIDLRRLLSRYNGLYALK